jgi:single-strand DNA-binding protein
MQIITIAGNIGRAAETRQTQSGSVTSFSVAVSAGRDTETTWYRCSLWGIRGKKLAGYLTKGSKVTVAGTLKAGLYDGKLSLEVNVADVALQGGRQDAPSPAREQRPARGSAAQATRDPDDDLDDEVPFMFTSMCEPQRHRSVLP